MKRFLEGAPSIHVLVAGDCMLDAYIAGDAARISPEAPVPVVSVSGRKFIAGGAANVAANVRAMGAQVALAGVVGADSAAATLRMRLQESDIGVDALVEDSSRVTTTKTRVTASGQQIVRFDEENTEELSIVTSTELRRRCTAGLDRARVCIISDYAKGVIDEEFCQWLIPQALRRGLPVVVDPKSRDLSRYRGATVITPNLKETWTAAGSVTDIGAAAAILLPQVAPSALLVTRGGDGMSLFEPGSAARHIPAHVNEVADVTGAGDTVVAALAVALGVGYSLADAAALANIAAGVAVGHHGTWAVTPAELRQAALK